MFFDCANYCTFLNQKTLIINLRGVKMSDSSNNDKGAFYSKQEGRIIRTGEIHEGPDGNKYEHLGNNEWKQID